MVQMPSIKHPHIWVCPHCLSDLIADENKFRCVRCGRHYSANADGKIDFSLKEGLTITLEYFYDPKWAKFPWDIVKLEWPQNNLKNEIPSDWEATEVTILPSIPPPKDGKTLSLDLGCGDTKQRFLNPLTQLGYDHIGIDIVGSAPDALADMHLLPFKDETFDFLITAAVFEHLKNPHVAMAEAARVIKKEGLFYGTIAFGEPYHISYFHHSPLAVYELLESSGFECKAIFISNNWNTIRANLEMGVAGARLPSWLRKGIDKGFFYVTILPTACKAFLKRDSQELKTMKLIYAKSHSAIVGFIAKRIRKEKENRIIRQ